MLHFFFLLILNLAQGHAEETKDCFRFEMVYLPELIPDL